MTKDEELTRYMTVIEQYKEQMSSLETQSSYIQAAVADYNKAQENFDTEAYDEALEALNDLKNDFIDLINAYEELLENLSSIMKEKVNKLIDALNDIIEEID